MHCRRPLLHRRLPQRAAQAAEISYVIAVPNSEPIICAVIATALFGGELRLMPPEQGDLPVAEYVFEVKVPDGGDRPANDFERAAYITLFPNYPDTPDISTLDGPLSISQREKLAARLRTIKRVRRASLAFVVRADFSADGSNGFAASHQVPVYGTGERGNQ